jgi:hypothetical protein
MILQVFFIIFVLFAASRAYLRFRDKSITAVEFFFWIVLWLVITVVVVLPQTSTAIAHILGVGRGADAVVYISVLVLFYAVFRLYVKMEFIEHEITDIVRKLALEKDGKSIKDDSEKRDS